MYYHVLSDIVRYDLITRNIEIIEVKICLDMHFKETGNSKNDVYIPLLNMVQIFGFNFQIHVLCFGSLRNITKECIKSVQKSYTNRAKAKTGSWKPGSWGTATVKNCFKVKITELQN